MTLALSPEALAEARQIVARLGVLLAEPKAAPEPAPAPAASPVAPPVEPDFNAAAGRIGCDVAAIRAVDEVESAGSGFGRDGRPTVLYEPHVFSRLTHHRFDATQGGVSYPHWGEKPYPKGTAAERQKANWDKIAYAARLDHAAAYQSASYGRFQIMGFNFADCGFADVDAFVAAMSAGVGAQLEAFVRLILTWRLDDELRDRRWVDFARRYNGPRHADHDYAGRLARAYEKWSMA